MKPTEHHSVQARIIKYAAEIGWTFVPQKEAEKRRGFGTEGTTQQRAMNASLYLLDTLKDKLREFNPNLNEQNIADILRQFSLLRTDVYGNRTFWEYLTGKKNFYYEAEQRELNLCFINTEDLTKNSFEVTEEFTYTNGRYTNREDIVFLINGIPILVIECKNITKSEAIAVGFDQIRRYQEETPELMVPQQLFTATESIGFSYGVTWNLIRRNIFNWKAEQIGNLELKIKTFCAPAQMVKMLTRYIMFAEQEETLNKFILQQHQQIAVEKVIDRAHDPKKFRGLVWHTQGAGKTYTMIKAAELLFKAPESDKPTILLMLDRNELEDQMVKNLEAVQINNVVKATSINKLNEYLRNDYRGIIITMIHKFRDMPANLNTRKNIYVLIDEAHRTTQGDLGTYLMAGLPHATLIGFTGTPIDKTVYGKGTFKTFGIDDDKGYLHKYSIADSTKDGTTLPLFYNMAPNSLLVPKELLEGEFYKLAQEHGVTDIEELNKILERAVNTKNFLKGKQRITDVAKYVAHHYVQNVEPLGYKAFLVAVDRETCAYYLSTRQNS